MLAFKHGARVRLISRTGTEHSRTFPQIAADIAAVPAGAEGSEITWRASRLQCCTKSGAVHGLDHPLDRDMRGVEDDSCFLVAKAHIGPADTVEPFQGSLDR